MKIVICCVVGLLLGGCASSGLIDLFTNKPVSEDALLQYNKQEEDNAPMKEDGRRVLYIKSRMFNYYDYITFAVNKKQEIFIDLFAGGRTIGAIEISKHKICILQDCARKWPAAKEFFGKVSYGDLFDDIFFQRDIFGGAGKMIEPGGGIVQRFQKNGQVIFYRRTSEGVLFKNMSNGVVISLFHYEEPMVPKDMQQ